MLTLSCCFLLVLLCLIYCSFPFTVVFSISYLFYALHQAAVNKESVEGGIKAVKTRKARYALFKVNNSQTLEIVLDKQSERKATKEEYVHLLACFIIVTSL